MKVTTPQMGHLRLFLEDLFERLGVEYICPPESSEKALEIGSRLGPELACLPLKITLGNLIQGIEDGANTVVVAGGSGPCRFGYYGQIQQLIMERAGYNFSTITIEPPATNMKKFIEAFKVLSGGKSIPELWKIIRISFLKAQTFESIEKKSLEIRAYEIKGGSTSQAKKKAFDLIRQAKTKKEILESGKAALEILEKVELDRSKDVLKIGLVGEFYLLLEPFANFGLEEYLGKKNIFVERAVYMSDWVSPSGKNKIFGITDKETTDLASPYLAHFIGGEGQPTIGHTIHFAKENFDGVIHLFPFTCMPEIIADNILPRVLKDYDIPVLTLVIDEQSGRAGMVTRLEAFIDLLRSRRESLVTSH